MAENNEYRIVIEIEGSGDKSGIAGAGKSSKGNAPKSTGKTGVNKTSKSLTTFVASQAIKPAIQSATSFLAQNVELYTGSTALQQKVDLGMQAVSFGRSVVSGAAAGAAIGGGIGGIVGASVAIFNKVLGVSLNQAQINLQKSIEDKQITQLRSRAGSAFNNSRRGA